MNYHNYNSSRTKPHAQKSILYRYMCECTVNIHNVTCQLKNKFKLKKFTYSYKLFRLNVPCLQSLHRYVLAAAVIRYNERVCPYYCNRMISVRCGVILIHNYFAKRCFVFVCSFMGLIYIICCVIYFGTARQ